MQAGGPELSDRSRAKPQGQREPQNSGSRERDRLESAAPYPDNPGFLGRRERRSGKSLPALTGARSGGESRRGGKEPGAPGQVPTSLWAPGSSQRTGGRCPKVIP